MACYLGLFLWLLDEKKIIEYAVSQTWGKERGNVCVPCGSLICMKNKKFKSLKNIVKNIINHEPLRSVYKNIHQSLNQNSVNNWPFQQIFLSIAQAKKKKYDNISTGRPQQKNTVAILNELRHGLIYTLESQTGPIHAPIFRMSVVVSKKPFYYI